MIIPEFTGSTCVDLQGYTIDLQGVIHKGNQNSSSELDWFDKEEAELNKDKN